MGAVTLMDGRNDTAGFLTPLRCEPTFKRRVFEQGVIVGARFMRQCVHEFMTTKRFPLNRGAGFALCVLEAYQGLAISLTATVSKLKDWAGTNARRVLVTEVGGI